MNTILKNTVAVPVGQGNAIGFLTWSSLSEMLITPDDLKQKMIQAGLGTGWMPKEIRLPDAFRRATSDKFRREVSPGIYENYMFREVASTYSFVQRNLVCETKDTNGRRLDYIPDAGALVLDRKTEKVEISYVNAMAKQLAENAAIRFDIFRNNYGATTLRSVIMNVLKSMSPTPVRPSGGVYFIPGQFEGQLDSLVQFVTSLEKGEAEKVPMMNTTDMKNMVTRKLMDHLQDTLRACENGEANQLKKNELKTILEDAKSVVSDYKEYESIVSGDLREMEACVALIREKIAVALTNMAD
ncbi:hypothetical protein J1TS5_03370 [Paenibacillus macerans]|uniref:DUF6744 family protein n=1 Tax=Paenibacillus macerans TaxID=44252 RepID=UPI001B113E0C|nr:DUF6744 family protein [Paenibacillus macerans]GIP08167.1 hypothetical protein J1TS5_03370 [Paenibacillus macerans]